MNSNSKKILIALGVLVLAGTLLTLGFFWGGVNRYNTAYGPSMMWQAEGDEGFVGGYGPSMMGGYANEGGFTGGYGRGMMGGYASEGGFTGGYGHGMMGGYGWQTGEIANPLSIEENEAILEAFLADNGWSDQLEIAEIMIFDNHAYAQLVEIESGIGAYEVLIDAGTGDVYPEHGANMMWDLKYGMHSTGVDVSATMEISAEQAVTFAQEYLDANLAGTTADDHAVPFYGYYTLHVLQDGEIVGMLSVYGASGEVLLHTWHGNLIEMHDDLH